MCDLSCRDHKDEVVVLQELRSLSQWFGVLWCGGEQASLEENRACRHINTSMLKSLSERDGLCVKIGWIKNVTLRCKGLVSGFILGEEASHICKLVMLKTFWICVVHNRPMPSCGFVSCTLDSSNAFGRHMYREWGSQHLWWCDLKGSDETSL